MKTERNFLVCSVRVLIIAVVFLASLFVTSTNAYAAGLPVGSVAYANVDTELNMRDRPQGNIIGGVPKGETVTILKEVDRDGYYFVKVDKTNRTCYVYGEFLKLLRLPGEISEPTVQVTPPPQIQIPIPETQPVMDTSIFLPLSQLNGTVPENATLVVTSERKLNLRKRSNRNGDRIKYLLYGDVLQVVNPQIKNNYILVKELATGKVGYVDIDYVVFAEAFQSHIGTSYYYYTQPTSTPPSCCVDANCPCLYK